MTLSERHMELSGQKVISHFTFRPPLIASASLEGHGCFIFPINTSGNLFRVDSKVSVEEDQGVLMKCGTYVNKWGPVNTEVDAEVIILRLFPEIIKQAIGPNRFPVVKQLDPKGRSSSVVKLDHFMRKYLESLFFYFDHPDLIDESLVSLKITELVMMIMKLPQSEELVQLISGLFEKDRTGLREMVETHFYEELSLEEMAALASMSLSTFKRRFKEEFGSSPGKYIREKRIEKARQLLLRQELSIAEIAYQVGYSDPNYFSKVFTSQLGYPPSRYRDEFS